MILSRPFRGGVWLLAAVLCTAALAQTSPQAQPSSDDDAGQLPREVIVVLDNGQRLTGTLVGETESAITLRVGSVDTTIERRFIERVTTLRPAIERYRSMRAIIADENVDQLLLLIDWLRAEGLYDEALQEVDAILGREPQNGRALQLRDLIARQKELRDRQIGAPAAEESADGRAPLPTRRPRSIDFPLITEADANLLKVYELDLRDPPRVLIDRATIDALLSRYGGLGMIPADGPASEDFRRWPATRQLEAMFNVRARDLYGQVHVLDLPRSLRLFRDNVQSTWLVNSCATTACHGGLDAGPFMLYNRAPTGELAALTNLLILERYRTPDGRPLLNYEDPERSLLLEFALTVRLSGNPHPDVRGWRPVFTSTSARRYQDSLEWMNAMIRPRPDAPIEYTPPTPARFRTTEPAPEAPVLLEPQDR